MFLRFRTATDAQFARLKKWFDDGKPAVALRTTSHAFVDRKGWFPPFFGGHYKSHAPNGQGTVTCIPMAAIRHALVRGVRSSVEMGHGGTYNAQPLSNRAEPILLGRTGDLPSEPIAWTHRYKRKSRIFYTSLGSRENFEREDFQTLLGNAVLWALQQGRARRRAHSARGPVREALEARPTGCPRLPSCKRRTMRRCCSTVATSAAWRHWDPSVEPLAIGIDRRADSSSGGPRFDKARWQVKGRELVARPGLRRPRDQRCRSATTISTSTSHCRGSVALGGRVPWPQRHLPGGPLRDRDRRFRRGASRAVKSLGAISRAEGTGRRTRRRAWGQYGSRSTSTSAIVRTSSRSSAPGSTASRSTTGSRCGTAPSTASAGRSPARRRWRRAVGFAWRARPANPSRSGTAGSRSRPASAPMRTARSHPSVRHRGEWKPDSKALFLRGGRLVYDIGWVGQMQSEQRYNDGKWHRVLLTHDDGRSAHVRRRRTGLCARGLRRARSRRPRLQDRSGCRRLRRRLPRRDIRRNGVRAQPARRQGRAVDARRGRQPRPAGTRVAAREEGAPRKSEAKPAQPWVRAPIRLQADSSADAVCQHLGAAAQ